MPGAVFAINDKHARQRFKNGSQYVRAVTRRDRSDFVLCQPSTGDWWLYIMLCCFCSDRRDPLSCVRVCVCVCKFVCALRTRHREPPVVVRRYMFMVVEEKDPCVHLDNACWLLHSCTYAFESARARAYVVRAFTRTQVRTRTHVNAPEKTACSCRPFNEQFYTTCA